MGSSIRWTSRSSVNSKSNAPTKNRSSANAVTQTPSEYAKAWLGSWRYWCSWPCSYLLFPYTRWVRNNQAWTRSFTRRSCSFSSLTRVSFSKINRIYVIARLLFQLDLSVFKLSTCAYNFLNEMSILFSLLAYVAYIGNWLSLVIALRVSAKQGGSWQINFLRYFKPCLFLIMTCHALFTVIVTIMNCRQN